MKLAQEARKKIEREVLRTQRARNLEPRVNLEIYDEVLPAGADIGVFERNVPITRSTAFALVDLAPQCNWAHPCEYLLHDAETGDLYETVEASFPPAIMRQHPERVARFHVGVELPDTAERPSRRAAGPAPVINVLANHVGERYAILFSGDSNNRHVNDMEFLYRTLIDRYSFDPAHIHVLNHDGTINYDGSPQPVGNWPGDNTAYRMIVNGQGTRAALQATIATLAGQIQPEDLLLIHTNNHGAGPCDGVTDYCICAYDAANDWVEYFVDDFVADLSALPAFEALVVMMEQCRSGGFIAPITNNSPAAWTHVATAVTEDDYSLGGANFDPFAEDWIAAIAGQYPGGGGLEQIADVNGDGRLAVAEAFDYADAVCTYDGGVYQYCDGRPLRLGDTPTEAQMPAAVGDRIFLGFPAHDLYLRDNLEDSGREPLVDGGISFSPDIVVYRQELLDPTATLLTPAAMNDAYLGEKVEIGQNNSIYLRVTNRGEQATAGQATLYWTEPSVLPTPAGWNLIAQNVAIPPINPGHVEVVGPITWVKGDIPPKGHYCFIGLVGSGADPAPDPAMIVSPGDFQTMIRESNNATWKNFNVDDQFANSTNTLEFHIQGWPREAIHADLLVDLSGLPDTVEATLRMLKRLSEPSDLKNLERLEETARYETLRVEPATMAYVRGMPLKPSDNVLASLTLTIPPEVADGFYRFAVASSIEGREMGRVSRVVAVGEHPFLANRNTHEVHIPTCRWAKAVAPKNREAYKELEEAMRHGYDGCHYCLTEFSED